MRTIFRFLILSLHCMRAGERERDGRGTVLALICGYYCLSGRGIRTTYEGDVFGCFILISYPFPALHSRDASTKVKRRGRKWLVKGDCMLSLGEKWESFTAIETTATTTTKEEKKKMGLVEEVSAAPFASLLIRRLPIVKFIDGFNTVSHLPHSCAALRFAFKRPPQTHITVVFSIS